MSRHCVQFVATLVLAATFGPVAAQRSSGNITGDGNAGDVVLVERHETGFAREIKLDADGKYRISRVPTGIYVVTVTHGDGTVERPREVRVQGGTTARVK